MPERCERSGEHLYLSNRYQKNYSVFLNPYLHFFQIAFIRGWSNLDLEGPEAEKKGPKNYTYSPAIMATCTTIKWVSKYDFIFK
jgi:hypothetical protein